MVRSTSDCSNWQSHRGERHVQSTMAEDAAVRAFGTCVCSVVRGRLKRFDNRGVPSIGLAIVEGC